jgi:hypothetical protein
MDVALRVLRATITKETTMRKCFYIPADAFVEGRGFVPSLVVEGEAGHSPLTGGPGGTPWYWGMTYEFACQIANEQNARLGVTPEEALDIIASSVAQGAVPVASR